MKMLERIKKVNTGGPESLVPYNAMLNRITGFQLSPQPNDYKDMYYEQWSSVSGTLMPSSPGVLAYRAVVDYYPDESLGGKIVYKVVYKLDPVFEELLKWIKINQPEQVLHRSRSITLACSNLRKNESEVRTETVRNNMSKLDKFRMPVHIQDQVLSILNTNLQKYMKYDRQWKDKYISQRLNSSTGEGLKWQRFIYLDDSQWSDIFERSKEMALDMTSERYAGFYHGTPMYTGIRSRSAGLGKMNFGTTFEGEMNRSRIIMFHPALSIWTLFIPDKKGFYADTINQVMDLFNMNVNFTTPIVDGGQIYADCSDLLCEGYHIEPFDGKNWEAQMGVIMDERFSQFFTYIDGLSVLPSGITFTSWLGTVCTMWVSTVMGLPFSKIQQMIVLGDDLNCVTDANLSSHHVEGVMEYQPDDKLAQFMLGVSYREDTLQPRIQGIKLMSDRGDKAIHMSIGSSDFDDDEGFRDALTWKGKHDERTRELWYGLHLGYFGSRTLIDAIKRIPSDEFKGPTEMIHQLVEVEDLDQFEWDDLIEWRRQIGKIKI